MTHCKFLLDNAHATLHTHRLTKGIHISPQQHNVYVTITVKYTGISSISDGFSD